MSAARRTAHAKPRTRRRRSSERPRLRHLGRALALVLLAVSLAGGVALVHGPWLRVQRVAFAGTHFTPAAAVEEVLEGYRGTPVLALDSASLADRLMALPAVAGAHVAPILPNELRVTIDEKEPAFIWLTSAVRLVGAADGTLIAELARDAEIPAELAELPTVDDQRLASRQLIVGDVIDEADLEMALGLLGLDRRRLGSLTTGLAVRIDEVYGFILVSGSPSWRAAMGFPEREVGGGVTAGPAAPASRLDRQVAAIRTLFRSTGESDVTWIDVRNPGKVYWAR